MQLKISTVKSKFSKGSLRVGCYWYIGCKPVMKEDGKPGGAYEKHLYGITLKSYGAPLKSHGAAAP